MSTDKVRVVVGDDHPMFRDGVVRALQSSGSIDVVAEADDGPAALAAIREHRPQVALLDYRMPGMDGATLLGEMRKELGSRCPKVLFVSATPPDEVRAKAESAGARPVGYVKKPFHLDDLSKLVAEALAA